MAKSWLYKYGEDSIKVINKNFDGSELYINGELCDRKKCTSLTENLAAALKSGKTVTATLGCSTVEVLILFLVLLYLELQVLLQQMV